MTNWITFANLSGNEAASATLDPQFANVAAATILLCSVTGVSTIQLTVIATLPTPTGYVNNQRFAFIAAGASSGSVTINVNSLGALNLYAADGVTQIGSGGLESGVYYDVVYNSALNGGSGGFQMVGSMPISNMLDLLGATQGDVLYRDASGWAALAPGTSGYVLTSGGSAANPSWTSAGGGGGGSPWPSTTNTILTTSATVTIPANCSRAYVEVIGGGAGGSSGALLQGGGAGAFTAQWFTGLTASDTLVGTVGAGGAGSSSTDGASGGQSSLASGTQTITTLSANGGNGSGAVQATTSGGAYSIPGGAGSAGFSFVDGNSSTWYIGGYGGHSAKGRGGAPCVGGGGNGNAGLQFGGGGSSGGGVSTTGGNGASGGILIWWFT